MSVQRAILGMMALFVMMTLMPSPATAIEGNLLLEILLEKGIITKDDLTQIKAEEKKREAARAATHSRKTPQIEAGYGEETPAVAKTSEPSKKKDSGVKVGFGKKGFTLATRDGLFKTKIQWRFQGRYTYPERSDPRNASAFSDNEESTFELRRVRMKVGGHGYKPWIKYYFEVDWQPTNTSYSCCGDRTRLIDWRIMLEKYKWLKLRIGQWKINYSRERVDSSGKQTMVERSIMNRVFTIDRQVGMMLYGRVNPGTILDTNYYLGIYSGSGRATINDDDNMMYMGRIQWNVFGRELKWRQSDVKYHKKPTASISYGAYTVKGRCTRWSSSGCGQVSGFDRATTDGQYQVSGMQVGSAMKYRGWSWQHETHWKQIKDTEAAAGDPDQERNMFGGYLQTGYFPHYLISAVPKPLEIAFRYSHVDPNVDAGGDLRQEFTTGLNWFFAGHRNKLTLDASHLTLEQPNPNLPAWTEQRVRLQWDVSF
ncbi:MAG: porin [Nitrospira sp.]|nr:porin [Nitrospira sp.]